MPETKISPDSVIIFLFKAKIDNKKRLYSSKAKKEKTL